MSIHSVQNGQSSIIVPCPLSKVLRIIGIKCDISGPVEGDQVRVEWSRDAQIYLVTATAALPSSVIIAQGFLGGCTSEPLATLVDPITGIVTYVSAGQSIANFGLPDVAWDWDVNLKGQTQLGGGIVGMFVVYELKPRPRD